MSVCPTWCTRTHVEGPDLAIVHEGDTVTVEAIPTGPGRAPTVTAALIQVDDEPAATCIAGDLLDADNAERLAHALLSQAAAMRAERTLQVTR